MSNLEVPFYTVPGNHDVRGGKEKSCISVICHRLTNILILENTGLFSGQFLHGGGIKPEQWTWLEDLLDGPQQIFVAMHVPAVDPPRGKDHAFLDKEQGGIIFFKPDCRPEKLYQRCFQRTYTYL